jgi:hypothetical protein
VGHPWLDRGGDRARRRGHGCLGRAHQLAL